MRKRAVVVPLDSMSSLSHSRLQTSLHKCRSRFRARRSRENLSFELREGSAGSRGRAVQRRLDRRVCDAWMHLPSFKHTDIHTHTSCAKIQSTNEPRTPLHYFFSIILGTRDSGCSSLTLPPERRFQRAE